MREGPVWKQDTVNPGDIIAQLVGEEPIIKAPEFRVDPRKPRYVFNPFRNRKLQPWYQRQYGLMKNIIPERGVLPLINRHISDTDYDSLRSDGLEQSERWVPPSDLSKVPSPDQKEFERLPAHIVLAMMGAYGHQYQMPTGFCSIESLDGHENINIAVDLTRLCFPGPKTTVHADIDYIDETLTAGRVEDDLLFTSAQRVLQAMHESRAWAEEHMRHLISQLDSWSEETGRGKRKADRLDVAVCEWLGVPEPKRASKTIVDGPQKVQIEMVPGATAPSVPTTQCPDCGNHVNLLADGSLPRKGCYVCGWTGDAPEGNPEPSEAPRRKTLEEKQAEAQKRNGK